jgi:hypothetical protein
VGLGPGDRCEGARSLRAELGEASQVAIVVEIRESGERTADLSERRRVGEGALV